MKKEKVLFTVITKGKCKQVFIPRKYCTIYLQNQKEDYLEINNMGKNVCIENLAPDMACQTYGYKLKGKKVKVRK